MKTSNTLVLTTVFAAATLALAGSSGLNARPRRPSPEVPSPRPQTAAASSSTASATPTTTTTTSSTTASPAAGLRGYRRYHTNGSYIGRSIPCTYEEKLCLRHNVLFQPAMGRCLPNKFDETCEVVADRAEFSNGSGHLYAVCPGYRDPCYGNGGYRMAFDGRCYPRSVVQDVLCGCADPPIAHFLGGVECRCGAGAEVRVQQPAEDGRCRVPDLRFPDNERAFLHGDPAPLRAGPLRCSRAQAACFSQGKVQLRGEPGCARIGERGPCAADHVVVLDREAALTEKRARGTCVHVRGGCPAGERRFAFDGQCHKDSEIRVLSYGYVHFSEDGRYSVNTFPTVKVFSLHSRAVGDNGSDRECVVDYGETGVLGPIGHPLPPCGADNRGRCSLYEVEAHPPDPLFDED